MRPPKDPEELPYLACWWEREAWILKHNPRLEQQRLTTFRLNDRKQLALYYSALREFWMINPNGTHARGICHCALATKQPKKLQGEK